MRTLLLIMLLVLGLFLAGGLVLPSQVHVERSIAIQRPPATVFTLLNSFEQFDQWSPWAEMDPNAEFLVTGPPSGVGARISWTGDPALVGSGWQEIVASEPFQRVVLNLDFGAQGVSTSTFTIAGDPLGSRVSWSFDADVTAGQNALEALMARYFGLFLDNWIGSDYERGLMRLKTFAETLPRGDFANAEIELLEVEPQNVLSVSGVSSREPDAIGSALARAFEQISSYMAAAGLAVAGAPMAITRVADTGPVHFSAAIPVSYLPAQTPAGISAGQSPSGRAARIVHRGPYDNAAQSYARLDAWLAAHGHRPGGLSWEVYVDDPAEVDENRLQTHIYYQLAESN